LSLSLVRADRSASLVIAAIGVCATIACGATIMMTLAIINGSPFIFWDSALYLALGELLTAHDPAAVIVSLQNNPDLLHAVVWQAQRAQLLDSAASHLGARPVLYSLYADVTTRYSMWAAAVGQCLFVAASLWAALWLVWRQCLSARRYLALVAVLTALTAISVETPILMPDAFTAPVVLLVAALFAIGNADWRVKAGIAAAIAICGTMHLTHAPIALLAALIAASIVSFGVGGEPGAASRQNLAWIAAAVIVAFSINAAANVAAAALIGRSLHKPPFLTARVIDDGPGAQYLIHDCGHAQFVVCHYAARILAHTGDDMMWSPTAEHGGVYIAEGPEVAAGMRRDDLRFVQAAVSRYPLRQLIASVSNVGQLMMSFNVADHRSGMDFRLAAYRKSVGWIGTPVLLARLPNIRSCSEHPTDRCGRVPLGKLRALHYPTLLASVLLLLWQARLFVARNGFDLRRLDRIETFAICVVVGILANDIVCGVLSGPYERYQVRVIWLVPMLALATLICAPEKLRRRARG
jgi:hypothetical protein